MRAICLFAYFVPFHKSNIELLSKLSINIESLLFIPFNGRIYPN